MSFVLLCVIPLVAVSQTLTLTMSGPQTAREGDLIEYRIEVVNQGTLNLEGIEVLDTLPATLEFVQAVSTPDGIYEPATGIWTLPSLGTEADNSAAELRLQALVRSGLLAEPTDVAVAINRAQVATPSLPEAIEAEVATNILCAFCIDWQIVSTWIDSDYNLTSSNDLEFRYYIFALVINNGPVASEGTVTLTDFTVTGGVSNPPLTLGPVSPVPVALAVGQTRAVKFGSNWVELPHSTFTLSWEFEVADVSLLDPVLPNTAAGSRTEVIEGSDSTDGCFIATAAYGSYLDPHVGSLRRFRDQTLMRTRLGRGLVAWYYEFSPPMAQLIERSEALKTMTRLVLTPVVFAIENPVAALAALCGLLLLAFAKARKA